MLSNVTYQRDERLYQVMDPESGVIETFPSGNQGRRDAMRCAVQFQSPRLYRIVTELVQRYPVLESRAWRAAELALNGSVKSVDEDGLLATVTGSDEYGDYLVKSRNGFIQCDCIDFTDGNAPYVGPTAQRFCKHILAVQFTRRLAVRACGSCGQEVDADLLTCPHCRRDVTPY